MHVSIYCTELWSYSCVNEGMYRMSILASDWCMARIRSSHPCNAVPDPSRGWNLRRRPVSCVNDVAKNARILHKPHPRIQLQHFTRSKCNECCCILVRARLTSPEIPKTHGTWSPMEGTTASLHVQTRPSITIPPGLLSAPCSTDGNSTGVHGLAAICKSLHIPSAMVPTTPCLTDKLAALHRHNQSHPRGCSPPHYQFTAAARPCRSVTHAHNK